MCYLPVAVMQVLVGNDRLPRDSRQPDLDLQAYTRAEKAQRASKTRAGASEDSLTHLYMFVRHRLQLEPCHLMQRADHLSAAL